MTFGPMFSQDIAPQVRVPAHGHPPNWLLLFALLVPAVFVDLTQKYSIVLQSALAGLFWAVILYGFASPFLPAQFQYGLTEFLQAAASGLIGGALAGVAVRKIYPLRTLGA